MDQQEQAFAALSADDLIAQAQRAAHDGQTQEAIQAWRTVQTRFPDRSEAVFGEACLLRDGGDIEGAAAVLARGVDRFPDDETMHLERGWSLCEAQAWDQARAFWSQVRERFPLNYGGYLGGGLTSRKLDAFVEADAIYELGLARLPPIVDLLRDYAWSAYQQRDWPRALKRWEHVMMQFPDTPDGPCRAGEVLMELGRLDDAVTVLGPARRLFPRDPSLAVISGFVATRRGDVTEAERAWADVRALLPDELSGWSGWATALIQAGRSAEAEPYLLEAAQRHPAEPTVAMDLARVAGDRRDWETAVERWRAVVARFGDQPQTHIELGWALVLCGRDAEARICFEEALARFPDDPEVIVAPARAAQKQGDWREAERRWVEVTRRLPTMSVGYIGIGEALREAGLLDRSAVHLRLAAKRFPGEVHVDLQLAMTLSRQRNWSEALPVWEALKRRHPDHASVQTGIREMLFQARQDQGANSHPDAPAGAAPFEIPEILTSNDARDERTAATGALLMQFESLGDTCEFGIVQRRYGAEPLSLLRWSSMSPSSLVEALQARFEGVGDPDQTIVADEHGEYITRDKRYHMFSHTFTPVQSEPIDRFVKQQLRRMQYLRRKLLEDLGAAAKLFVFKSNEGVSDTQLTAIYRALLAYSQENALLCVRLQDPAHPKGTLDRISPRLWVGYIDRFSTVDIAVDTWVGLCQRAHAQYAGTVR